MKRNEVDESEDEDGNLVGGKRKIKRRFYFPVISQDPPTTPPGRIQLEHADHDGEHTKILHLYR